MCFHLYAPIMLRQMETSLYCLQCFKLQNYIFFFKYRKQAKENILLYIYNVQVLHNLNHAWYKKSGRNISRLANPQRMDLFWSLLLVEQSIHGLCLCGINLSLGSSLGSIYLSLSLCFSSINL